MLQMAVETTMHHIKVSHKQSGISPMFTRIVGSTEKYGILGTYSLIIIHVTYESTFHESKFSGKHLYTLVQYNNSQGSLLVFDICWHLWFLIEIKTGLVEEDYE